MFSEHCLFIQLALASGASRYQPRRQYDDVLLISIRSVEHVFEVPERIVVAHANKHIARSRPRRLEIYRLAVLELELIELGRRQIQFALVNPLRDGEDRKEGSSKNNARNRGYLFG